jgi:hypothetical protein
VTRVGLSRLSQQGPGRNRKLAGSQPTHSHCSGSIANQRCPSRCSTYCETEGLPALAAPQELGSALQRAKPTMQRQAARFSRRSPRCGARQHASAGEAHDAGFRQHASAGQAHDAGFRQHASAGQAYDAAPGSTLQQAQPTMRAYALLPTGTYLPLQQAKPAMRKCRGQQRDQRPPCQSPGSAAPRATSRLSRGTANDWSGVHSATNSAS